MKVKGGLLPEVGIRKEALSTGSLASACGLSKSISVGTRKMVIYA